MNFSDRLLDDYKVKANNTLAIVCRWVALLMALIGVLNLVGVFVIESAMMYVVIGLAILIALFPTLIFNVLKINKQWAQYMVLTTIVFMCGIMYAVLSYHTVIMLVFPLSCASLYSDKRWIIYTILISIPTIVVAHFAAFYLNVVPDEPLVTLHGVIMYGIIPRLIQFIAIGIICLSITEKMRKLLATVMAKNDELYENQQELVESLSELVEAQSQETGMHVKRVREYTRILCEGLGYDPVDTWTVSISSMMHDVGKLLVPSEIIEKPGKLTEEEFEQVKLHVDHGRKMLEKSPGELMQTSANIAAHHHERWDGKGYKGLRQEEISMNARCVAVADVFDALVSKRPYKKPWTAMEAYDEIVSQSGRQFDPQVVQVFKDNFDKFKEVLSLYPESQGESEENS